ncbi:hypothetical protein SMICM17S_10942 [Streptomyces microflavus]
MTERHLRFKGGRVKIASTGAEEAAAEPGQHARRFRATPPAPGVEKRTVRVRSRLVAGVAVVGVIVLAAGAPAALSASTDLAESQRLVTLAELNRQAVTLAHSLADERDAVTAYIAGGRADDGKAGEENRRTRTTRVDQQIDEIHGPAPAALRRDLSTVPSLRRDALTGKGSALDAHHAYSEVIAKLHGISAELAAKTPPRVADATRAPLALGGAVEQASATRGLLLAALAVPSPEPATPQTDPFTGLPVEAGWTRMRSVESALGATQVQRLEGIRDDDVTALELSIALLGGCFLLAVGVSTAVARTLTQPLAVLRMAPPASAAGLRAPNRSATPAATTSSPRSSAR